MATRAKPKKLDLDGLWEYALRALGQRAHSSNELRQKLMRRAASPADVSVTMDKLKEYGMTDDRKFSEAFALSRLQNRGFGQFRVLRELRSKRVAEAVAKPAIEKAYSGKNEQELIEDFLARKYRGKDLREFLQDQKNLAGVYRRLRTAGFSSPGAFAALKKHAGELEEWDDGETEI